MRKGFTLIELIIVIIVVGILASVAISQYIKTVEKGRATEARVILGTLRTAEIAKYAEEANYATLPSLNVEAPSECVNTHYFSYACTTNGTCTATRCTTGGKTPFGPIAYTRTLSIDGVWQSGYGY